MQKQLLTFILSFLLVSGLNAQTIEEFFNSNDRPVFWLGVDFSQVQLIGDFSQFFGAGEKDPAELTSEYFPAWNELILNESNKYDVKGMVRKSKARYDLDFFTSRNALDDPNKLSVFNHDAFTEEDIKAIVESYDMEKQDAFGYFFVAEVLNKSSQETYFHLVIIDMNTGSYLFSSRVKGAPKGFGIRNYWGGAIYDVIKSIKDYKYKVWYGRFKK